MAGRLSDKVAIVTGSSSGIGQAIAVRFGSEGASVVVDYRKDIKGAEETGRRIEAAGGKAILFEADVSKLPDIEKLVEHTWQQFGRCDILVNNAGIEKG